MLPPNNPQHTSIKQLHEKLIDERQQRISEVNFLLGKAIPKLEHEYLYCISLLEREVTVVQAEIAEKSEMIRLYEEALEKNIPVDEKKVQAVTANIRREWEEKIQKHAYRSNVDFSILPELGNEREHKNFLLHNTTQSMNAESSERLREFSTELFRRITTAYREGNLGELRALRMIIESKQSMLHDNHQGFSVRGFLQSLSIRVRTLCSMKKHSIPLKPQK